MAVIRKKHFQTAYDHIVTKIATKTTILMTDLGLSDEGVSKFWHTLFVSFYFLCNML